ncbi:MAG TPA: nucleotidyltransferase domain-containing protein [Acidimicrobiia bacterium]|jgi:predicted nucleotidyltransferase|nr:nucleotidyltransferase domain-containing protein [Acidimicrobiia bacterium]
MSNGLVYDKEQLRTVCEKYSVIELRIFGSYARGTADQESDVDILYRFKDIRTLGWSFFDFCDELETIFNRKVDVVPLDFVPDEYVDIMITPSVELYRAA